MPKLANTPTLNDYSKLPISSYRDYLKQHGSVKAVTLSYIYLGKEYSCDLKVSNTPCTYGGYRYWWLCPQCSKRVSVLYCAGLYVCRHCINAPYGSQLQQPIDRVFSRISEIRARLGWQQGVIHGVGAKPRYMHSKAFDRLVNEHDKLSAQVWQQTLDKLNCTH